MTTDDKDPLAEMHAFVDSDPAGRLLRETFRLADDKDPPYAAPFDPDNRDGFPADPLCAPMATDEDGDDYTDDGESCWKCGGAGEWHDCGEDSCCCLRPDIDEMVICDECNGEGLL